MVDFNLFSPSILSQKEFQTPSAGFEPDQLELYTKAFSTESLVHV